MRCPATAHSVVDQERPTKIAAVALTPNQKVKNCI